MVPDGHIVSGPDIFSAIKEAKILSMGPKCGKEHISVLSIGWIFQQRRKKSMVQIGPLFLDLKAFETV